MDIDNVQTIVDTARFGITPITLDSGSHHKVIYTPTHGIQTVDLGKFQAHPARKTGTVTVFDGDSFTALLAEQHVASATKLYVNPDTDKPAIVAVIDGHSKAKAGFGEHRIQMGFRETPQWKKWRGIDGKLLPQADFAEFVEDNVADIASPDGAVMLEIVQYLQATRTVEFRSGVKISNGNVQLTNNEDTQAQVGAGNIAVPEMFEIALSPMFGVQPFKVPARFRYRIEDRKLRMGFKLQRLEDVMAQVIKDIESEIDLPEGVVKLYGIAP